MLFLYLLPPSVSILYLFNPFLIILYTYLQIQLPTSGIEESSSDSSDLSSEDDSTAVPMNTQSRRLSLHRDKQGSQDSRGHSTSISPEQTETKELTAAAALSSLTATESKSTEYPGEGSSSEVSAPCEKEQRRWLRAAIHNWVLLLSFVKGHTISICVFN